MRRAADPSRTTRGVLHRAGFIAAAAAVFAAAMTALPLRAADGPKLRVCSDPDNMPLSNAAGEGFENKLAALVAGELGKRLVYTWAPQDDNFVHETLSAHRCDVIIGVPRELGSLDTTRPYYWSSYVLVSRADRNLDITSLKDHRLDKLKIGVASINGNRFYSPPAQVLAHSGSLDRIIGYPNDGVDGAPEQRAAIIAAVVRGDIDVAAVWGPLAGYFVQRSPVPMTVRMIGDTDEFSARKTHFQLLALQFEIGMAVRKGDGVLRGALDAVIARRQPEITTLLKSFGVPLIEPEHLAAAANSHSAAPD